MQKPFGTLSSIFSERLFGKKIDKNLFGTVREKYSEHPVRNKIRLMFGTNLRNCSENSSFCVPNSCSAKYWRNSRPAMYLSSTPPPGMFLYHSSTGLNFHRTVDHVFQVGFEIWLSVKTSRASKREQENWSTIKLVIP